MLEGLQQLIDLQKLDDELFAAEEEIARLPERRATLVAERESIEVRAQAARQKLEEAEGGQRRAETQLQDDEALLQRLEGQQFQVKSNDAYAALLHEMEQAREGISKAETLILEAMESIEAGGQELARAEKDGEKVLARVEADEGAIDTREGELAARVAELHTARSAVLDGVDAEMGRQYERIAKRHRPAVAYVIREVCQGCRVNVPPQLQIELLRGARLITCMNCNRILIHEQTLAPK